MKTLRFLLPALLLSAIAGCEKNKHALQPVSGFDLSRYAGTWYEAARFPHWFERGLTSVTAEYALRKDGTVTVTNRGYDPARGKWKTAVGRARLLGAPDVARLGVTFFWPFSAPYQVIRLDPEYRWAVVTTDTYDYLWILSRTPALPKETLEELVAFAKASGFDVSKIEYVDQAMNAGSAGGVTR